MKSHIILFLASNPSNSSSTTLPLWHDSRSRKILDQWLSKIKLDHPHSIHFANVSDHPTENNRPLKMTEIRLNMDRLRSVIDDIAPTKIVALGKTANTALTLLRQNHLVMPHPSGMNRQLNDPKFVEEKIKELQSYLQLID
jgi:uracil-DNA glycosylase